MSLYAAIGVDSKVALHARLSWHRGRDRAEQFLEELKKKHRVTNAEFLVDGMGYFTALARTDLSGKLNYTDRNIVEKLFQTCTMRIKCFHEMTAYTAYYNHHHSHQTLDDQPTVETLKQRGSI